MADDLRTRIAAVLYNRVPYAQLSFDNASDQVRAEWLADADAVIAELGLREELVSGVPFNGVLQRRIISDWKTFNSSEGG